MRKTITLLSIGFSLAVAFSSCEKTSCDVTCNNGGTCIDGACNCPAGWIGTNCETSTDSCFGVICRNSAPCVSGVCNCLPHYSGDSCTIQETPDSIYIIYVHIRKFSPADSLGNEWDDGGTTDIYPKITLNGAVLYDGIAERKLNNYHATSQRFIVQGGGLAITDITNPNFRVEAWDWDGEDGTPDQYMYGINFTPYYDTNGFPYGHTIIKLGSAYSELYEFRVDYLYSWP